MLRLVGTLQIFCEIYVSLVRLPRWLIGKFIEYIVMYRNGFIINVERVQ